MNYMEYLTLEEVATELRNKMKLAFDEVDQIDIDSSEESKIIDDIKESTLRKR
jgi:hypothetical protein